MGYQVTINYKQGFPKVDAAQTETLALDMANYELVYGAESVVIDHSSYDEPVTYVRGDAGGIVQQDRTSPYPFIMVNRRKLRQEIAFLVDKKADKQIALTEANNDDETPVHEINLMRIKLAQVSTSIMVLEAILRGDYSADKESHTRKI
ncbi:hypothetical protein ABE82_26705 (plasmid) [Paenibacillus peoriae]|uniref:hypothetical protein n=1 Tax=Paenibacillus peoriae TaxID=59893 RepID=UPI00071F5AB0|nr:hypothetical protein [Paenibacillus peoriae]ALS10003.1 hypothetical protein ABE82_26705 [Paenibacillus peoriae]